MRNMKQKLIRCLAIALAAAFVICLAGCLYNHLAFEKSGHFPLGFKEYGGECMMEQGFGMRAFHVYPMTDGMDGSPGESVREWFSLSDFGLWWAGLSLPLFLLSAAFAGWRHFLHKRGMTDGKHAEV